MSNKEIIQKIRANEKKINELTKQRNETIGQIMKLYEMKIKENERK